MLNAQLTLKSALKKTDAFIKQAPDCPSNFADCGIIIPGGGLKYFTNAWVTVRMLRKLECNLPIQIWHLGPSEIDDRMRAMTAPYDVEFIDAYEVRKAHPIRNLNGWELKPFSILHSRFKDVILIDADNVPVVNPDFLFKTPQYKELGAIFWPDFGHLKPSDPIWDICGVEFRDEPEWESGQIVVNKERCWSALQLAMWYNNHSDFFYQYILGDKDTYHLAFRKLNQPVAMPSTPVKAIKWTLCQHDFDGNRIFQHRVNDKWSLEKENDHIWDFQYEADCRRFLEELQTLWFGKKQQTPRFNNAKRPQKENELAHEIIRNVFYYERIGFDSRPMTFGSDGCVKQGAGIHETYWDLKREGGASILFISSKAQITCSLTKDKDGIWKGHWLIGEGMPITLRTFQHAAWFNQKRHLKTKRLDVRVKFDCDISPKLMLQGRSLFKSMDINLHASIQSQNRKSISINTKSIKFDQVLWVCPSTVNTRIPKGLLWATFWDPFCSTPEMINRWKMACGLIVPSEWDASGFSSTSINQPIWIQPLGIDKMTFNYLPINRNGPCVFGILNDSPISRSHISIIIECFLKAFPETTDVMLNIYQPNVRPHAPVDSRIKIIHSHLTDKQYASWLHRLTCFISSKEPHGWSTPEHKVLSVGRPLLGPRFGRIADLLSTETGYPVEFSIKKSNVIGSGIELNSEHMIFQMQQVYNDGDLANKLGLNGTKRVENITHKSFFRRLAVILKGQA